MTNQELDPAGLEVDLVGLEDLVGHKVDLTCLVLVLAGAVKGKKIDKMQGKHNFRIAI